MIGKAIDNMIASFSPLAGVQRAAARKALARYQGAESSRLTANKKPLNQSADDELRGANGADSLRAWARMLVRDNAWAWGVVDTIVSSVVGQGIRTQSILTSANGDDEAEVNEKRDDAWERWIEVCDATGQKNFYEMQALIQREIVEAGECLVHMKTVDDRHGGVDREVPLVLNLIDADRLASYRDTFAYGRQNNVTIVRGVEFDTHGRRTAYWIYPSTTTTNGFRTAEPVRVPAADVLHLYRSDRIGQSRGVSWFAPVLSWMRDLGVYVDNELQASAVASCFTVAIKSETGITGLSGNDGDDDASDSDGNPYEFLQPGLVMHLRPNESIESANPGRPNSASEPWINLMLRGIAVGTGLSYETVSRDYSKTNYSSNRASQLEDRRRFRCWQNYLKRNLCQQVWDRFVLLASMKGLDGFPSTAELLSARQTPAPVEHQATGWEWVDPTKEQAASEAAIVFNQSTYKDELGAKGKDWRRILRQRSIEQRLLRDLELTAGELIDPAVPAVDEALQDPQATDATNADALIDPNVDAGVSTDLTLNGAQILAAIDVLEKLKTNIIVSIAATELLVAIGIPRESVIQMVAAQVRDADEPPPPEPPAAFGNTSPPSKQEQSNDDKETKNQPAASTSK